MAIDLDHPLDMSRYTEETEPGQAELRNFLEKIQGNILKGQSRKHALHLLLWFHDDEDSAAIRRFLADAARRLPVTTAYDQRTEYLSNRKSMPRSTELNNDDPAKRRYGLFCSIMLSRSGYERMEVPDPEIPKDPLFFSGMRNDQDGVYGIAGREILGEWDPTFLAKDTKQPARDTTGRRPDAMILLAHDRLNGGSGNDFRRSLRTAYEELTKRISVELQVNNGELMREPARAIASGLRLRCSHMLEVPGQRVVRDFPRAAPETDLSKISKSKAARIEKETKWVEHFGFRDDISRPLVLIGNSEDRRDVEEALDKPKERSNPAAPLSTVLVREPWAHETYGSFVAFQKIEQHPKAFLSAMKEEAVASTPPEADAFGFDAWEWAAGTLIGRLPDGTLVDFARRKLKNNHSRWISPTAHYPRLRYSHYTLRFDDDPGKPRTCPFYSHVRKMNSRGDLARDQSYYTDGHLEREMRIVRRGIPYEGDSLRDLRATLRGPAIRRLRGTRNPKAVGLAFLSYQSELMRFAFHHWRARSENYVREGTGVDRLLVEKSGRRFTTLRGGEYFFAPSVTFLRKLDAPAG